MGEENTEDGGSPVGLVRKLACITSLLVFICSLFTAAASITLLFFGSLPLGLSQGLRVRIALFTLIAMVSGLLLKKCLSIPQISHSDTLQSAIRHPQSPGAGIHPLIVIAGLFFAALLAFPNLDVYPWAAPDEMHHLVVAKNLAVHGEYASGSLERGFKRFDAYDSVGPAVIVPVALVFNVFGVSVWSARMVMALYFLALCLAAYWFVKPVFGHVAGLFCMFLIPMAFSSIYLGRTLYGEVPGLCFILLGLSVWRCAFQPGKSWLGLPAGIVFGLAILCKTILVLAAFPALGVLMFDRLSHKRLGWTMVVLPMAGAAGMVGGWLGIVSWFGSSSGTAGGTWGLYQHYLLFGLAPAWHEFQKTLLMYPLTHLVLLAAILSVLTIPFFLRYDPPMVFLMLCAGFFAYWWLFFTPGQLPRYLWYCYATAGMCLGISLYLFLAQGRWIMLRVLTAVVLVVPFLSWTGRQAREVYTNKEMQAETALAHYISGLPAPAKIATTFPPLCNSMLFLTGRTVHSGDPENALLATYDLVIHREPASSASSPEERIGPYILVKNSDKLLHNPDQPKE